MWGNSPIDSLLINQRTVKRLNEHAYYKRTFMVMQTKNNKSIQNEMYNRNNWVSESARTICTCNVRGQSRTCIQSRDILARRWYFYDPWPIGDISATVISLNLIFFPTLIFDDADHNADK